ncbi:MAG: hypothetical protein WCE79_14725 [Xanthobacteraceae bacterium]
MAINRADRVLIVLNHIASGDTDYLYRFIEESGRGTVQATLGDDYAKIVKLYGANATLEKLIVALRTEGAKAAVQRIDLIVMLHGSPGKIWFNGGKKASSVVKNQIKALNLNPKLRLVYSTCCFGDSHSADFIAAGFDSAIGSKKVNANAAVEFPQLLSLWQFDFKLSDCLAPSIPLTSAADAAARAYGQLFNTSWKNEVDSTKVLRGNPNLKIST